jgi:prepilin-type processing-associated H-X9-DG protein
MQLRWLVLPLVAAAMVAPAQRSPVTPEATVRAFLSAIEKSDLKAASVFVHGSKYDARYAPVAATLRRQAMKFEISGFIGKEIEGAFAATFKLTIDQEGRKQELPAQTLKLRKAGGMWKILSGPWPAEPSVSTQIESLATLLAHPEAMSPSQPAPSRPACVTQLKKIGVAIMLLAKENGDKILVSNATLKTKLVPYLKDASLFRCSAAEGSAYTFNDNLKGASLGKLTAPARTVLVYEGTTGKLAYRHDGRSVLLFADGHVRQVTPEEAKKLVWKP